MRCVIAGNSVKLFARAIHCLAKIGEEIYLEPLTKGLSLRTVNSSRSAYACFLFLLNFFQSYDDGLHSISASENTPPEDILKCKLSVKSFLSVFKSLSTVEKIVDRCSIKMDLEKATLTFLLYCRHGITKTYNLSYQDCESLQAVFTKDLCPNVITAQPSEVVMNFQNTQEEITLTVCPQHMKVTNYVDDEPDPEKVIRTEMVLVQEEFDKYQIGVDTEVTFCLKELKGILTFAESSGQPMDIYFEYGGKPIVFSLNSDATFEANFVLATLVDQPTSSQYSQQTNNETVEPQKTKQTQKTRKPQKTKKPKETESHSTNHVSVNGNNDDEFGLANDEDWDERALDDVVDEQMAGKSSKGKKQTQKISHEGEENPFEDPFEHQDLFSKKARKPPTKSQTKTTQNDGGKANEQSLLLHKSRGTNPIRMLPGFVSGDLSQKYSEMQFLGGSISADSESSPGIAVRSGKNKDGIKKADEITIYEDVDLLEDSVPGTPPSKKFKSMFFSAMTDSENPSTKTRTVQETSIVLAADTDDESD